MKIIIEDLPEGEEDQILIRCRTMTPDMMRAIALLKASDVLTVYEDNQILRITLSSIYYIEAVDNHTYVYLKDHMYESRQKLYELEELLKHADFLRISKSVICSLRRIRRLTPALNGRFEALLENGEKVLISRQYAVELKKHLGI